MFFFSFIKEESILCTLLYINTLLVFFMKQYNLEIFLYQNTWSILFYNFIVFIVWL